MALLRSQLENDRRQRRDHHDRHACGAQLLGVGTDLLVQTGHDHGHVVTLEGSERPAVQVGERDAGVRGGARERLAHMGLQIVGSAIV